MKLSAVVLPPTALSCPLKKIPNSNKEDGITGKVGDAVYVKCNGQDPSFVTCTGVGPETAAWTGFSACFGILYACGLLARREPICASMYRMWMSRRGGNVETL